MSSTSFWQTDFSPTNLPGPEKGPLRGAQYADVAIVGAGITGMTTALWWARGGMKVTVLEGRQIAAGGSGRNAGMLAHGTTGPYANTIERHGREKARRIWAFTVRNHELAAGLIAELTEQGWDCGY